jgi:hypothetical protein
MGFSNPINQLRDKLRGKKELPHYEILDKLYKRAGWILFWVFLTFLIVASNYN